MASTDSRPVPIKNTAFRAVFPIYNNTGALVAGAAGLDSEVSKDQGAFADCTNEATEIATSSGVYYLDLTSTEMNADCVAVIVKTSTTDAKTTVLVLYPQESGDIKVDVQSYGGTAGTFSGGRAEVNVSHIAGSAVSTSTAQLGVNVVNFGGSAGTFASGRPEVNASHIGGSAISQASGVANVNVTQLSGDSVAADNAEAFFDGTGYAGTGNTMPTVTSVTNQVTANVTGISGDATAADNLEAALDGTGGVTITAALTGNITGNLSGSVGSVTGAVGSVTGAVGSVTGAVGSVTGAVGSVTGNVGGNVVGSVGSVTTVSDKTGYRLSATGVDDVWDEAMSGHTTAGTFGDKFRAHAAAVLKALVTTGSTTTSVVLNATTGVEGAAPSSTNDFYNGRVIIFITGTLAGQATDITDYDGSTKALTVTALTGAPSSGDTAVIV